MSKKPAAWSLESTIALFKKVPAPLKSLADVDAFEAAMAALGNAETEKQQSAACEPVSAEIARIILPTLNSKSLEALEETVFHGLRMLALMAEVEGTEVVIAATQKKTIAGSFWWQSVMDIYASGHPLAGPFFGAMAESLPQQFAGIALLDAANAACREHGLKAHPFDNADGVKRLTKLLKLKDISEFSFALSAAASLPFLAPRRRTPLMTLAAKHKDAGVRMELAWAQAKLGKSIGAKTLAVAALHPHTSSRACDYLEELGLEKKIPAEALNPDFAAMAAMCDWLSHPNEFGEPPTSITLFDTRTIYWPPAGKKTRAWLFEYTYAKTKDRPKAETGVGIAGPILFAMFDEATPNLTPERIYGLYCEMALQWDEDKRAPKKRTGKKGWDLIAAAGK
jgi:hypothetical protein